MKDWNSIYVSKGKFQDKPSERAERAINFFEQIGVKKILDLGCGTGRHIHQLVKAGLDVYGCDISEKALEIAKKEVKKGKFRQCDMTSLDYDNNFFDAILCNHVIQHGMINEVKKAVFEMYRVLKKGGFLFLIVVSTEHPGFSSGEEIEHNTKINTNKSDGKIPHHFFTEKELITLFKKFKILRLRHYMGKSELYPDYTTAFWEMYARKTE